jgi:hypothetical protein
MTQKDRPVEEYLTQLDAMAGKATAAFSANESGASGAFSKALAHLAWVLTAKPIPKDRRHIAVTAYASRVMQHAYGAYRLIQSGNTISAEVVVRAAFEAAFSAGALANDENFAGGQDFYLRLLFKSTLGRLKPLKDFLASADSLSGEDRAAGEQKVAELQGRLDELKAHQLSKTAAVAKAAKMEDYYGREYASQSRVFHSDLEVVLQDHVLVTESEVRVAGVQLVPAGAELLIAHLIAVLMETATTLTALLQIDLSDDEKSRFSEIAEFYGNTLTAATTKIWD